MKDILRFISLVNQLKDLKRTGWLLANVDEPESVADHSFSLALLSTIVAKRMKLNVEKCVKFALIHDINEVYTGDIASRFDERNQIFDNKTKAKLENKNMLKVISVLESDIKKEFLQLWKELIEQKSKESILVKQLDSLDYSIMTLHYKDRSEEHLTEFLKTAEVSITLPELKELLEEIKRQMST